MKQHGLPVDESLIFDAGNSQAEDGYNITEKQILNRLDEMDALIFSNDDIAVGAMKCFNDHNIAIPDRISVIGRHNIPASAATVPPLTTMTYNNSDPEVYTKLIKCLDSYIRMEPDLKLEKELNEIHGSSVIIERETVKDLNRH
jgi:LacI family transcriptional regulator